MSAVQQSEFRLDPKWQAVFREHLATTSRDLPVAVNSMLMNIAMRAARETPKADREKFERELGVESYRAQTYKRGERAGQAKRDKKGNVRFQRVMKSGATLANLIVNARLGRSGKPGLKGSAMKRAVAALISRRARAVGTLKSGWAGAVGILARALGLSSSMQESVRVKGRSVATPAKAGWNPSASLSYRVNSFDQTQNPYIDARTRDALAKAFEAEGREKMAHMARKMAARAEESYRKSK